MGKNYRRNNGAPSRKGNGVSSLPKRFKVKYGEFALEGSGHNAVSDMQRAGIIAATSYGMLKQTDQSISLGSKIGNMLFEKVFGGADCSPVVSVGSGNDTGPGTKKGMDWIDVFHQKHQMPSLFDLPYQLGTIVGCFPIVFAEAVILHLLAMFGALCFSRVRAKYSDGKLHSPSLQVVIEAISGAGKGKIKNVFDLLFSRVKEEDDVKYAADDGRGIIQIVGINTTPAKFFQITARNQGVHMYMIHPEISHVARILKKSGGLSYEHLRCAFDNDEVEYSSMAKKMQHGRFPVFLNYTFTGTQESADDFIAGEETGGTAQRICWATIPEYEHADEEEAEFPEEEEMEYLKDQIDAWRQLYCFENSSGVEKPCSETIIDLDYVKKELAFWIKEQSTLSDTEDNPARKAAARREAAIAFHIAMVLHMLYNQPKEDNPEDRKKVVTFTLYLADYCMERYLQKFGKIMNASIERNRQKELVSVPSNGNTNDALVSDKALTPEELYRLHTEQRLSYRDIETKYPGNNSHVTISKRVKKYAIEHGLPLPDD